MAEISTNTVLDGITLALRAAYPASQIEIDTVKQGLTPPAFIVRLVSSEQTPLVGTRWHRVPRFDVLYFPQAGETECYTVADNLCSVLEVITLWSGDKLRGSDISFERTDGVLHFFVSYKHNIYTETVETAMEDLTIEQEGGN